VNETSIDGLFDALQEGDERALQKLLPPLRVRLARLAKQRLGGQEVEEVVQETLSTLWEKRQSVREPGHLLPFLFQTLRHKVGSAYLRARRERMRRGGESGLRHASTDPAKDNPEALLVAAEVESKVMRAIQACAAESQALGEVLLHLREGRSAAEIQGELGDIPIGAVRTRICRARKRLREILREDFHLDL
jgi:DNA-directed RNA polymerase specialized sigma24 family protein